jgi:protein AroM
MAQVQERSTTTERERERRTATVGVLTIGQSPRPDGLGRDIRAVLGPAVTVIERGALDGLSRDEIAAMSPKEGDYRLITLLNDGTSVQLSEPKVLARIQAQITDLEQSDEVDAVLLMCTGEFPRFEHAKPLLAPQDALYGTVIGLAGDGRVGDLVPLAEQIEYSRRKWRDLGAADAVVDFASPYGTDPIAAIAEAAGRVRAAGATVLFMDCFGFNLEMKAAAQAAFGGPVVLARSMAARLIAEMIA